MAFNDNDNQITLLGNQFTLLGDDVADVVSVSTAEEKSALAPSSSSKPNESEEGIKIQSKRSKKREQALKKKEEEERLKNEEKERQEGWEVITRPKRSSSQSSPSLSRSSSVVTLPNDTGRKLSSRSSSVVTIPNDTGRNLASRSSSVVTMPNANDIGRRLENGNQNHQAAKAGAAQPRQGRGSGRREDFKMSEHVAAIYKRASDKLEEIRSQRAPKPADTTTTDNGNQVKPTDQVNANQVKAPSKDQQLRRRDNVNHLKPASNGNQIAQVKSASNDQHRRPRENGNRSDQLKPAFNGRESDDGNREKPAFNGQQQRQPAFNGQQRRQPGFNGQQRRQQVTTEAKDERESRMTTRSNSPSQKDSPAVTKEDGDVANEASKFNNRRQQRDQVMTLQMYEKKLQEKKKVLESMKSQDVRVVTLDKDFESMRIIEKNKEESIFIKLKSESHEKVKKKATMDKNYTKPLVTNFNHPVGRRSNRRDEDNFTSVKYEEAFPAFSANGSTKQ